AAAPGVQLARHRPDDLGYPPLNRSGDVLVTRRSLERARLELLSDLRPPRHDPRVLPLREQPVAGPLRSIGHTAADVRLIRPPVKAKSVVELAHQIVSAALEAATPQAHGLTSPSVRARPGS